jgi:Fe-S-cluster-containing hydrogenase component 2
MKVRRKIIEIDEERCDGCGLCVPSCAEGALQIIDGKARLVAERYCDGLGACLGECPKDALRVVEREAEEFDEEAVEEHIKSIRPHLEKGEVLECGCPSAQLQTFPGEGAGVEEAPIQRTVSSALTHWPVQIRLVPPFAPFLKRADLLVVADCTPLAYPNFHQDFLKGKVVLVGCPKFDDAEAYIQKFHDIFKEADIKSVTVVVMEVPCCQGLPIMVERGMDSAGKKVPMEKVIVSIQGEVLQRQRLVA